jgi:hypothetical protein
MAVPLIVSVQPALGPTGGQNLVTIRANNLRVPPDAPPLVQTSGVLPETVRVEFGGEVATAVKVITQGVLTCLAPIHDPGLVDVTVQNLDDNGDDIAGETATKTGAYTFARPNLTVEDDLTRLVRTFLRELRRQVVDEVSLAPHTDYDDDATDFLQRAHIAKMPGLAVIGPDIDENRFFSTNTKQTIDNGNGTFDIRRSPYTVDLQFVVVGVAELSVQKLNLMAAFTKFINRNKFIQMDRDPDDLSAGRVLYEMDFIAEGGEPSATDRLNDSNVKAFSGTIIIRGFDLEDLAGVAEDMLVERTQEIVDFVFEAVSSGERETVGSHPTDTAPTTSRTC